MNKISVVDSVSLKMFEGEKNKMSKELYSFLRMHVLPDYPSSVDNGSKIPVKILVSIRTDYSNEVIVPDNGLFYTDCTVPHPSFHPIDDEVILSAKTLVDKLFDCKNRLPEVIKRTTLYPLGAFVLKDIIYVYVNVVIDCTLKTDGILRLRKSHFEYIENIVPSSPLEKELYNCLTIVRGEN